MLEQSLIPPLLRHFEELGYVTCTEFRTPWAIPDVLAVFPDKEKVAQRLAKGQKTPLTRELYWEVLGLIPDKGNHTPVEWSRLAESLHLSPSYFRKHILARLSRNSYIEVQQNRCVKINGFHPYCTTLVSVEAKVKNWRRAGDQALRHQHFVNQAFVALPSQHIGPALRHLKAFEKANIGLFEVDEGGHILSHHMPEPRPAIIDTLYYVALDSLWDKVQDIMLTNAPTELGGNNGNQSSTTMFCT